MADEEGTAERVQSTFTIMTFNILADAWTSQKHYPQYDQAFLTFDSRIKRNVHTIQAEKPDIIHLQEVDELSLEVFQNELSEYYEIHVSWHNIELWASWLEEKKKRNHGNAILVRRNWKEITSVKRIETSTDGNFGIIVETSQVLFINVHLEFLPNETRARQMEILFKECSKAKKAVIWAGDFNVLQENLTEMDEAGFHAEPVNYPTCFYDSPKTIDHVYASEEIQLENISSSKVASMEECLTEYGSDHVPVICRLRL